MSKLKELQKWIKSFQDVNGFDPSTKSINLKIVELLKEEVSQTSVKSKKLYFRDCKYSDYSVLREELGSDEKFVSDFKGVDLKAYIEDALAWSEKGNLTTEKGWLLTLRNWMRKAKGNGTLIMISNLEVKKQVGHINY